MYLNPYTISLAAFVQEVVVGMFGVILSCILDLLLGLHSGIILVVHWGPYKWSDWWKIELERLTCISPILSAPLLWSYFIDEGIERVRWMGNGTMICFLIMLMVKILLWKVFYFFKFFYSLWICTPYLLLIFFHSDPWTVLKLWFSHLRIPHLRSGTSGTGAMTQH